MKRTLTQLEMERLFGKGGGKVVERFSQASPILRTALELPSTERDLAKWDRDDLQRFYADTFEAEAPPAEELERDIHILDVVSQEEEDRHKSIIKIRGIDLKHYRTNPVVLWMHNASWGQHLEHMPIARSEKIVSNRITTIGEDGEEQGVWRLVSVTRYTPEDIYPAGHMVGKMVRAGFINASSIGVLPLEVEADEERDEGRDEAYLRWRSAFTIKKSELTEYSICPIGSNRKALASKRESFGEEQRLVSLYSEVKRAGISIKPLIEHLERLLDHEADSDHPEQASERSFADRLRTQLGILE